MGIMPEDVARTLLRCVERLAARPEECARSPGRDFTRRRKIPLERLLWTLVTWGEDTISAELADAFGWDGSAPTCSAFCQRRSRLRADVMPRLHAEFLAEWHNVPFEGRFRLVAVDGTTVQLPPSGDPRTRVRSGPGPAEHNEAHPTALFDVRRHTFEDMAWRGARDQDEPGAFCELADRFDPGAAPDGTPLEALFLGDRNFCTRNCIWHLESGGSWFVLRASDDWVERFLGPEDVPEGCFDVTVERIVVRTTSLRARSRPDEPEVYRRVKPSDRFDGIARGSRDECPMTLRIPEVPRLRAGRRRGVGPAHPLQRLLARHARGAVAQAQGPHPQEGAGPHHRLQGDAPPAPRRGRRRRGGRRTPLARRRGRAALRQEEEDQVAAEDGLPPLTTRLSSPTHARRGGAHHHTPDGQGRTRGRRPAGT